MHHLQEHATSESLQMWVFTFPSSVYRLTSFGTGVSCAKFDLCKSCMSLSFARLAQLIPNQAIKRSTKSILSMYFCRFRIWICLKPGFRVSVGRRLEMVIRRLISFLSVSSSRLRSLGCPHDAVSIALRHPGAFCHKCALSIFPSVPLADEEQLPSGHCWASVPLCSVPILVSLALLYVHAADGCQGPVHTMRRRRRQ